MKISEKIEDLFYYLKYNWNIRFVSDWYYSIRDFVKPRQSWIMAGIPNSWCDKTWLIPNILYKMVIHYIEEERALETIDWEHHEDHSKCAAFLKDCYKWIRETRPALEKEIARIEHEGAKEFGKNKPFDEIYPNLMNLEKELDDKDEYYLTGIIKYRHYLWT